MATKKFKCNVCGYIHEGDAAPANCPVCGVPASEFTELKPEKKGLFSDKNGNAYIIMYSTVMVVVVAVLLASNPRPQTPSGCQRPEREEAEHPRVAFGTGQVLRRVSTPSWTRRASGSRGKRFALLNDLPDTFKKGKFPIFEAKDGRVVIPVTGMGLWGRSGDTSPWRRI